MAREAIKLCTGGALALALAACATAPRPAPPADPVEADIRDVPGRDRARASITSVGGDLRLRIEALGLAPGAYGIHVHEVGRCDPPGFTSAGAHWNPEGRKHGKDNPQGMHKGDLPNLLVGSDGRGTLELTIPGAALSGTANALLDADGAAIVIHAAPDDYRTDPSGSSGARIACGVFG